MGHEPDSALREARVPTYRRTIESAPGFRVTLSLYDKARQGEFGTRTPQQLLKCAPGMATLWREDSAAVTIKA